MVFKYPKNKYVIRYDEVGEYMAKKIQCPFCEDSYISIAALQEHIEEEHIKDIPKDFTINQYLYYIKTGKTGSKCVMCKRPTQWNESTNKYNRLCGRKECTEKYREMFKQRMIGKYGKTTLLNDPDQQRKMLEHRKISGRYKWSDKTEKTYTGTYELDFLKMLDLFMNWDSSDIMCPSPHTYYYEYDGEKKFYIPDMYIPSLNLEIEIKESDNHHPHMEVDRKKELLKDSVLNSQKNIDYIKIVDKNYDGFIKYLSKRKEEFINNPSNDTNETLLKLTESLDSVMNIKSEPIIEVGLKNIPIDKSLEMLKYMVHDNNDFTFENYIDTPKEITDVCLEALYDMIRDNPVYEFQCIENDYTEIDDDIVDEAVDTGTYPVYIMLMHSGTLLSNAIKNVTHSEFSHCSISFDSSMTHMYSFGRKFDTNPFIGVFKEENIHTEFFTKKDIPYSLYVLMVNKQELNKMKKRLKFFIDNESKFKYNFIGLLKNYVGIPDNREYRYFCSQFVSDIINSGRPIDNRDPSLVRPIDFKYNDNLHFISSGLLNDYDKKNTDREVKKILKQNTIKEAILSTKDRNNLDDKAFGLPEERKFPLTDENHVRSAIQYFKHCPSEKRKELGKNIGKAMDKFNMKVKIGKDNPAYQYISKKYIID